ncbi:DUF5134 domain-containing protein [Salinicola lusitanus]|uniref:DUF5134 domain-containing protein n=1 Tax=Salinicola lusitanus TaxID=1949085 RepID=A0ABZ3CPA4_9GAMM
MSMHAPYGLLLNVILIILFIAPALYCLYAMAGERGLVDRCCHACHFLMCAGMLVMLTPWRMSALWWQMFVFGLASLWFLGLAVMEWGDGSKHSGVTPRWPHLMLQSLMMLGMVWMLSVMLRHSGSTFMTSMTLFLGHRMQWVWVAVFVLMGLVWLKKAVGSAAYRKAWIGATSQISMSFGMALMVGFMHV